MGSDDGLAPTRRQAIIWTNDGYITEAYMRLSTSINELKCRKHHVQQHVLKSWKHAYVYAFIYSNSNSNSNSN